MGQYDLQVNGRNLRSLIMSCMFNEIYASPDGIVMFDANVNLLENIGI